MLQKGIMEKRVFETRIMSAVSTSFLFVTFAAVVSASRVSLTYSEAHIMSKSFSQSVLDQAEVIQQITVPRTNQFFRSRRQSKEEIFIIFDAFNETFSLRLYQDEIKYPKIHKQIKINLISDNKVSHYSVPHLDQYTGELLETKSKAYGFIKNGTFSGNIQTVQETYYLEPLNRYLDPHDKRTFIYRASDIASEENSKLHGQSHCALVDVPDKYKFTNYSILQRNKRLSKAHNDTDENSLSGKYCTIHMIADHSYFQNVGKGSVAIVMEQFETMLADAGSIYSTTDFNFDGKPEGVTFTLMEVSIFTTPSKQDFNKQDKHKDYKTFLDDARFGLQKGFEGKTGRAHDVCMNAFFTHTAFESVLGVTWGSRGICDNAAFNILLVSALSHERTRNPVQMANTLSHELGHAFNSPHDPEDEPECNPQGRFGAFLMSTYVNDFKHNKNKRLFSKCSRESIMSRLLDRPNCLLPEIEPRCGNSVLEKGEECDCGHTEEECKAIDPCCTPSNVPGGCKFDRTKGSVCSPLTSPCCDKNCQFTAASEKKICATETDCAQTSYCNGTSPECPKTKASSNKYCMQKTMLCHKRICKKSTCSLIGQIDCQCKDKNNVCILCCQPSTSSKRCIPFSPSGNLKSDFNLPLDLMYGSPCNNNKGFCNKTKQCQPAGIYQAVIDMHPVDEESVSHLWYHLFLGLMCLLCVGFLTQRYYHNRRTRVTMTMLNKLREESVHQSDIIAQQKLLLENNFRKALDMADKINELAEHKYYHRLAEFFPNTTAKVLSHVEVMTNNEKDAVTKLISLGEPLKGYDSVLSETGPERKNSTTI